MGPEQPLPLPREFIDPKAYVESLLSFGTSSQLFQTLCGGVHILDFFTRSPDLYTLVLPEDWREWFKSVDVADLLDFLMREDLDVFSDGAVRQWSGHTSPPPSLVEYVKDIRKHLLDRDFRSVAETEGAKHALNHHVAMGMSVKKVHEVDHFARYVDKLTSDIGRETNQDVSHLVDFGSGQNYLGRALASEPYNKNIIAVESRPHVVEGAKKMDVIAKLAEKTVIKRNKKAFRAGLEPPAESDGCSTPACGTQDSNGISTPSDRFGPIANNDQRTVRATLKLPNSGRGSIQYVQHRIENGDLSAVVNQIATPTSPTTLAQPSSETRSADPALMVMSLHSCGNLLHHGLRTLSLNPSVRAVAMIGCCYNLLTERLGPPTLKNPILRGHVQRLEAASAAYEEHGFPMSERLAGYKHRIVRPCWYLRGENAHEDDIENGEYETGIRVNITARMMAVQAPSNWTTEDSAAFFTRHFYRAVLQRIFFEKGIVEAPSEFAGAAVGGGVSPAGTGDSRGTPVVIGTLGKKCYASFLAYVRGAVAKIVGAPHYKGDPIVPLIKERMGSMTDEEIIEYETRFQPRKKELEVVWSLMAFSAGVIEAMIVVDRWLWLKEQDCVEKAWVESVFEYSKSPRNLVVVGIKKAHC